jgi:ParB/RepB/Spo0J family partition protein
VELELRQLQLKYANLRVTNRQALGRLVASLSEVGQQSPVLVVMPAAGGQPVLIDGYRRVAALERLARDTVQALQLGVDEAEALLLRQRMAGEDRRSALEDGWLLRELQDAHGVAQRDLGTRLGKSTSWVSRRLGLVRELPDPVQDLVRRGGVPAHAAMKYLLPLARANAAASERLTVGVVVWSETTQMADPAKVGPSSLGLATEMPTFSPGATCTTRVPLDPALTDTPENEELPVS